MTMPNTPLNSKSNTPSNQSTQKHSFGLLIALLLVMAIMMQFGADSITPSLPAISEYFNTSSTQAQYCVGLYILGTSMFQFIFGPLSDIHGRKKIILIGFLIFCFGTALSLYAQNITTLLISRFIQGAGLSSLALFRSVMRDLFSGKQLAKVASILAITFNITPALAPIAGGYIQTISGNWRMNFLLLLILGMLSLAFYYFKFNETLPKAKQQHLNIKQILIYFKSCFSHKKFVCYTINSSMAIGSFFIFAAISSFLFQDQLGYTAAQYGLISVASSLTIPLGALTNNRLLNKFSSYAMLMTGSTIMLIGSLSMLLLAYAPISLFTLLTPMILIFYGMGFIYPNAFALAFKDFGHIAGIAGAAYGGVQMLGASLASLVAAQISHASQAPLGGALVVCIGILFLMGWIANR